MNMEHERNNLEMGENVNFVTQDETLMLVDSGEEDWYCLHDVTLNGQILEYNGQGTSILDVGLAQAKQPLNTTSHYFEIEIVDPGENCFIAIGLTEKDYPKNRLPGWDKGSIAYHADDGKVFIGCGVGEKFGPKCYKGDTMGCGISFPVPLNQRTHNLSLEESKRQHEVRNERASQDVKINGSDFVEVFFTKNGTMVGVRRVLLPFGGFLPSIGMLSFHEKVKVNLKPLTG
uniref:B30.2/SPRY domain-containing protein n=1 Tax=Cuerna arida TaxID=1464854 RepID=A0A1B6GLK8_9HEMI